ncbi:hypothetical protein J6590_006069 [Homalodisca vitripennis]|nr:hypothetical protein J6590_006069 [Homalodisca vitripennis]
MELRKIHHNLFSHDETSSNRTDRPLADLGIGTYCTPKVSPKLHQQTVPVVTSQSQVGRASYPTPTVLSHLPSCPGDHESGSVRASSGEWAKWGEIRATMVSCDRCSKTFLPHRLEAHQRVCGPQIVSTAVKPSIPKQVGQPFFV